MPRQRGNAPGLDKEGLAPMSDKMFAEESATAVVLMESERQTISLALSQFIDSCIEVPEVDLGGLQELCSKFLMPQDIAA
jgi:hypothetical protein